MSWKSIELQVALPRTQDAGKLQDQMLRSNQHFQESLAQSQLKQEQQNRKKVNKHDATGHVKMEKEEQQSNRDTSDKENKNKHSKKEKEMNEHPYLGTNIDISR